MAKGQNAQSNSLESLSYLIGVGEKERHHRTKSQHPACMETLPFVRVIKALSFKGSSSISLLHSDNGFALDFQAIKPPPALLLQARLVDSSSN